VTYGLAALNNDLDTLLSRLGDPSPSTIKALIDAIEAKLDNGTYGLSALQTILITIGTLLIDIEGTGFTKNVDSLVNIRGYVDEIEGLLKNATYGLSPLKTLIDALEAKLDNATYGLAALKTLIDAIEAKLDNATYGLAALNTDLDTLLGRLTATRAGYLDNLSGGAVALNSDMATLLTRLSAIRAGYLDNLNNAQLLNIPNLSTLTSTRIGYLDNLSGGAVALEATLTAMKGAGWSTETLKVIKDAITALNNITAADVWGYATRTLTSPVFGDLVTKNLAHILSDSVAFKGADIATILSEIQNGTYGLSALDTDLNTLLTRLSATRAGYLDNLSGGAVALNSDIATLLSRLSAARAVYLDNLNNAQLLNVPDLSTLTAVRIAYLDNINQAGLLQLTATRAGYLDILNTDSKYIRTTALTGITAYSLSDLLYISATEKLRDFIAKTGGTVLPASKSLYDILWVDRNLTESGSFTFTVAMGTTETDISALFTTPLTGTKRRKYWVYLDMTNPVADGAAWTTCIIKVKVDVDGTGDYRTIDKATKTKTGLGDTEEPGVPIEIPSVARNVQIKMQFDVALQSNRIIYYHVVQEKLEY